MGPHEGPRQPGQARNLLRGGQRALLTSGEDYLELFDAAHSVEEDRFIAIGPIRRGLVLLVWTERDEDVVRIISARWATGSERRRYHAYMEQQS